MDYFIVEIYKCLLAGPSADFSPEAGFEMTGQWFTFLQSACDNKEKVVCHPERSRAFGRFLTRGGIRNDKLKS
jgi:hypothetical protein